MEIIIRRKKEYWNDSFKKGKWDRLLDKKREKNTSTIADFILSNIKDGEKVLDVGAGNGALSDYLFSRNENINYHAWDISIEALNSIKTRHSNSEVLEVDLNELDKINSEEKFEFIVLNEILYYVGTFKIFRNIKKLAKGDSKVIVSMYDSRRSRVLWLFTPWWRVSAKYKIKDEERGISWTIKVFSYGK